MPPYLYDTLGNYFCDYPGRRGRRLFWVGSDRCTFLFIPGSLEGCDQLVAGLVPVTRVILPALVDDRRDFPDDLVIELTDGGYALGQIGIFVERTFAG
jgi:hypothetical protein